MSEDDPKKPGPPPSEPPTDELDDSWGEATPPPRPDTPMPRADTADPKDLPPSADQLQPFVPDPEPEPESELASTPTPEPEPQRAPTPAPTRATTPEPEPEPAPEPAPIRSSAGYDDYDDDEPPVPTPDPDADLGEIVGVSKPKQAAAQKRFKLEGRAKLYAILGAGGALLLAVVVLLSWLNSRDYYLTCGPNKVLAQRGSMFPWGKSNLDGAEFAAIKVTPASQCKSKTFRTEQELREAFATVLLAEASSRLSTGEPTDIDEAEEQLQQALLLARTVPSKRAAIESLQGDVEYWRAASEINAAIEQLDDAAQRFETAAEKKPRHKTDASQWAGYTSGIAKDLRRGPPELRNDTELGPDAPPPFAGTDTAPAPARNEPPAATSDDDDDDDEPPMGVALPPMPDAGPPAPHTPDASLPTGGVLL